LTNYINSDNYFKDYLGKDIVRALLETAGYTIYHYGYQDMFSNLKSKSDLLTSSSNTGYSLGKSPDLLVFDDQNIILLEVELRLELPFEMASKEIVSMREYWKDTVLALVIPDKNVFYAQFINKLENKNEFNITDFGKLQEVFKMVTDEDLTHYRELTLSILVSMMEKMSKNKL
jgi:hypothetical protein